jgi:hypothetical protein
MTVPNQIVEAVGAGVAEIIDELVAEGLILYRDQLEAVGWQIEIPDKSGHGYAPLHEFIRTAALQRYSPEARESAVPVYRLRPTNEQEQ